MNDLHAILEIELSFPHKKSSQILIELTNIWDFRLMALSTHKNMATISMNWKKFKQIWGYNPKVGQHEVPDGLQDFISDVTVISVEDIN